MEPFLKYPENILMTEKPTYEELEQRVIELEEEAAKRKQAETQIREWKNRYEAAILASGHLLYDWNSKTNEVTYGGNLESMLGYCYEEMGGGLVRWVELVHPKDRSYFEQAIERLRTMNEPAHLKYRVRKKDGNYIFVEDNGHFITDDQGNAIQMVGFVKDITDRMLAEKTLMESEERYRVVLEVNPDPAAIYDIEGRVSYINPAFEQRFGWTFEEVVGKRIDFVPKENWPETKDAIEKMLSGKKIHSFETRRLNKKGKILDVQISSSLFLNRDGESEGSIVTLRDITARKQAEKELVKAKKDLLLLSRTDSLTGTLNRRAILSQIEIELSRVRREKKKFSLSLLDIDHFKKINDSHGHIVGDHVLREVVGRISSVIRTYDSLGRFGGEEFLIIIPGANEVGAYALCERIRSVVGNKDITSNGLSIRVTISQGVLTCDGNANVDDLVARADKAMYQAKKNGRNRVEQAII